MKKSKTIETYNKGSNYYAEKFKGIGSRKSDIDRAFSFIEKDSPRVLELGCGDGRDAEEILKLTDRYIGIDASSEMIQEAQKRIPEADFRVEDMRDFECSENIDIIFAFASLLHLNKRDFSKVLNHYCDNLKDGGIFYISIKEGEYGKRVKEDEIGSRTFYYYTLEDIENMMGDCYKIIFSKKKSFRNTDWLTIVLRKI